jgi:Ricin-type beta-trefoil lectin domain-like
MGNSIMLQCKLNDHVIDIEHNSTHPTARLDAFTSKATGPHLTSTGGSPGQFAPNQTWEVKPDPHGTGRQIIRNPAAGLCINVVDSSRNLGAALEINTETDDSSQLWEFLPDPFGSGYFFIQNPNTGYVIEIENASNTAGAALVVNPRRLFDNAHQLWTGIDTAMTPSNPFPPLTLSQPANTPLGDDNQYVFVPSDTSADLTDITVTIDIVEALVADGIAAAQGQAFEQGVQPGFSFQLNGNVPYTPPSKPHQQPRDTWVPQWLQFGFYLQNNALVLFNQLYHIRGLESQNPALKGNPLPSLGPFSAPFMQVQNNTVPAGTRIVLQLSTDQNNRVTGVSGAAFADGGSGSALMPAAWSGVVGEPASHGDPPLTEDDLAPLGSFQVFMVGPGNDSYVQFTSGMGTITVTCKPDVSAQLSAPSPLAIEGTGETSNCYYGLVQQGNRGLVAQPFGLPKPRFTGITPTYSFTGAGLYPKEKLTVQAWWSEYGTGTDTQVHASADTGQSQSDGSFVIVIDAQDLEKVEPQRGTLFVKVTDKDGNWVIGSADTPQPPPADGVLHVVTTQSGLRS